jgi:hypothetical protein
MAMPPKHRGPYVAALGKLRLNKILFNSTHVGDGYLELLGGFKGEEVTEKE